MQHDFCITFSAVDVFHIAAADMLYAFYFSYRIEIFFCQSQSAHHADIHQSMIIKVRVPRFSHGRRRRLNSGIKCHPERYNKEYR